MSNMIQPKEAVILASGYGRRMRRSGCFPSKPMTLVGNKPLISYAIDMLINSGIEKIYVVYHSVTSDVLNLLEYSDKYIKYLKFIEEDEQKGTLLTFSRIEDVISLPFLMVFEDIIADRNDFIEMLDIGKRYIAGGTDLVIQTVRRPSLVTEQAFLTDNDRVIGYQKNGILHEISSTQEKKCGGMVYLWLTDPFSFVDEFVSKQNYKLSAFLEEYIPLHKVAEMPIQDMWDIDTPEAVLLTEEILKKRGNWDVCIK